MLLNNVLKPYAVVLVSNSPRRRELLKGLEINFTSTSVSTDESYPPHLTGADIPLHIACEKANAFHRQLQSNTLAITADTVVIIDGEVLGKPRYAEEAVSMLRKLSGKTHEVITGVCLFTQHKMHSFAGISHVRFRELSDEEIIHYVKMYTPMDKAGSYGVQEWIGYIGIEHIEGSYYNVMGLPTALLYQELIHFTK
jgi:septum formation protein